MIPLVGRSTFRQCSCQAKRLFSTGKSLRIELSYQLIEPPAPKVGTGPNRAGRPLIFMHGLFGSKRNNRTISKVLAKDLNRDIFIVDLRNHGDTDHAVEHTYSLMAEDVRHFMRQHRVDKTVLIGHSMGAKTAMTLALQAPELVTGVIPVDNAPVNARLSSDFAEYVKGMQEIESAGVTRQSDADSILQKYENSLAVRQFLLTNLIRDEGSQNKALKFRVPLSILGPALDQMAEFPFGDDATAQYTGPTLFVRGLRSQYVSDKTLPAIKKFFPNAEIADVDAGHWVISEKPEEFRQAVVKFFKEKQVE